MTLEEIKEMFSDHKIFGFVSSRLQSVFVLDGPDMRKRACVWELVKSNHSPGFSFDEICSGGSVRKHGYFMRNKENGEDGFQRLRDLFTRHCVVQNDKSDLVCMPIKESDMDFLAKMIQSMQEPA